MILVSRRFQFLYFPVPKVACSSMIHWLGRIEGTRGADRDGSDVHETIDWRLHLRSHVDHPDMLANWPALVIVRDPWTRLASCFLDKFCRDGQPGVGGITKDDSLTFRGFVEKVTGIIQRYPNDCDRHIRPQHLFRSKLANYRMLRFRDLSIQNIGQTLGIELIPGTLPVLPRFKATNTTACAFAGDTPCGKLRARDWKPRHKNLYDDDLHRLVGEMYADDVSPNLALENCHA